jgi:Trehalose utilisation
VSWEFYKELTGQAFNGHGTDPSPLDVVWSSDALDFPAVRGMPSPWRAPSLWYNFDQFDTWSSKPGFKILAWVDVKLYLDAETVRMPVSFTREWDRFRSFYTVFGHDATVYQDPWFKRHLEAGILWTVRREHWLE